MVDGRGAEMDELGGVVMQAFGAAEQSVQQRVENGAVLQRANDRAVLRRDIIDIRRGGVAAGAGHVAHRHGRIPRNMFGHMPGEQPRIGVIAAARRGAHDHRDLPALVELGDHILRAHALHRQCGDGNHYHAKEPPPHLLLPRSGPDAEPPPAKGSKATRCPHPPFCYMSCYKTAVEGGYQARKP